MPKLPVRLWQTTFEIHRVLHNLPYPGVIVGEHQKSRGYRMHGLMRQSFPGSQISITTSGIGGINIGDREYRLTPGMCFVHRHKDPQVCYYFPPEAKSEWQFVWMDFYGGNVDELVEELNNNYGYIFKAKAELLSLLNSYQHSQDEIVIMPPMEAASLVNEALSLTFAPIEEEFSKHADNTLPGRVRRIIAADYQDIQDISELAARLQISREHLSRIFKEQTGLTLHEYLTNVRLRHAVDLLQRFRRLSIKEIAANVGFNDYSAFFRAFRQTYGLSPGEFRGSGTMTTDK